MCAISALNLAYRGQSTLEEAMQHYHLALAAQIPASDPNELLSDGIFLRHFLLFLYDISIAMNAEHGASNMWQEHLTHLGRIAIQRHSHGRGHIADAYVLMCVSLLDVYACLMGSGDCSFIRTMLHHNMLQPDGNEHPSAGTNERIDHQLAQLLSTLQQLNVGIIVIGGNIAQTARTFRSQARTAPRPIPPDLQATWQAHITRFQRELDAHWKAACPPFLQISDPPPEATLNTLPSQARYIFEHVSIPQPTQARPLI